MVMEKPRKNAKKIVGIALLFALVLGGSFSGLTAYLLSRSYTFKGVSRLGELKETCADILEESASLMNDKNLPETTYEVFYQDQRGSTSVLVWLGYSGEGRFVSVKKTTEFNGQQEISNLQTISSDGQGYDYETRTRTSYGPIVEALGDAEALLAQAQNFLRDESAIFASYAANAPLASFSPQTVVLNDMLDSTFSLSHEALELRFGNVKHYRLSFAPSSYLYLDDLFTGEKGWIVF
jgi:hypothetical protein